MNKFKVGDRVQFVDNADLRNQQNLEPIERSVPDYVSGKTGTITREWSSIGYPNYCTVKLDEAYAKPRTDEWDGSSYEIMLSELIPYIVDET